MKILISPYSKKMRNNKENPKNFPYWNKVVYELKQYKNEVIQIGLKGENKINYVDQFLIDLPFDELKNIINDCDVWVSVDNFLPHFCNLIGKPGIVIFAQSNPEIFGYKQNVNLLKDKKNLRWNQFGTWEDAEFDAISFVDANIVISSILNFNDQNMV